MSARPAAQRMAAARSVLPKVSGVMEAVLPNSAHTISKVGESIAPNVGAAQAKARALFPNLPDNAAVLDASTVARQTASGYDSIDQVPRYLKSGALKTSPTGVIKGAQGEKFAIGDVVYDNFMGTDIFNIAGPDGTERIAFGYIPKDVDVPKIPDDVKLIGTSPYDITGVSRHSEEGRRLGVDFADAQAAAIERSIAEDGSVSENQVRALLYAGSRGDESAMTQYTQLVEEGKRQKLIHKSKKDPDFDIFDVDPRIKNRPPDMTDAQYNILTKNQSHKDSTINELKRMGFFHEDASKTDTSGLFLVHEKETSLGGFEIDQEGNLHLRPIGDFQSTDTIRDEMVNSGAGQLADGENIVPIPHGENTKFARRTIHFSVNDLVGDVKNTGGGGRSGIQDSSIVTFRLDDALESNPGSLDNLIGFDTFLTPRPGGTLMIPKGKFSIIRRQGGKMEKTIQQAAEELGQVGPLLKFKTHHETSSTAADVGLTRVAKEKYRVASDLHDGTHQNAIDKMTPLRNYTGDTRSGMTGGRGSPLETMTNVISPLTPNATSQVSENFAASFYDLGITTGFSYRTTRSTLNSDAIEKLGIKVMPEQTA